MFSLKEYVSELIEEERQNYYYCLIDQIDMTWLEPYQEEITERYNGYHDTSFTVDELFDYLERNLSSDMIIVSSGYLCSSFESAFTPAIGEIEVCLERTRIKPYMHEVVSDNTELYISYGYGYIYEGATYLSLDFREINPEEVKKGVEL